MKRVIIILLFVFVFMSLVVASVSERMTVEANIFIPTATEPIISIEVPDYLFIGNLTIGEKTDKIKVYVNNTGNVNVTITPQLASSSEIIFNNLFFQRRTTEPWMKISNWNLNISKPSGSGVNDEYFYMKLDLTGFTDELDENLIGHKSDIVFWATQQ